MKREKKNDSRMKSDVDEAKYRVATLEKIYHERKKELQEVRKQKDQAHQHLRQIRKKSRNKVPLLCCSNPTTKRHSFKKKRAIDNNKTTAVGMDCIVKKFDRLNIMDSSSSSRSALSIESSIHYEMDSFECGSSSHLESSRKNERKMLKRPSLITRRTTTDDVLEFMDRMEQIYDTSPSPDSTENKIHDEEREVPFCEIMKQPPMPEEIHCRRRSESCKYPKDISNKVPDHMRRNSLPSQMSVFQKKNMDTRDKLRALCARVEKLSKQEETKKQFARQA